MRARMLPLVVLLLAFAAAPAAALQGKPKLGPDAVPITARTDYLRTAPAPDYWKLSAFFTWRSSPPAPARSRASRWRSTSPVACRPRPRRRSSPRPRSSTRSATRPGPRRAPKAAPGSPSPSSPRSREESLRGYGVEDYAIEVIRPRDDSAASLAELRRALAANEASGHDLIVVYFNQGVLTGDWDGPHISPIGPMTRALARC